MELTWQTICQLGSNTRCSSNRVSSLWPYTQAGNVWARAAGAGAGASGNVAVEEVLMRIFHPPI